MMWPTTLAVLALLTGWVHMADADARSSLLAFKEVVDADVLEVACGPWNETGPEPCSPSDQWGCVLCTQNGQLAGLELSSSTVFNSGGKLGNISEAWGDILGPIPTFQTLKMVGVGLTGSLPASMGFQFPYLQTLYLENAASCCFQDDWGSPNAWPSLRNLTLLSPSGVSHFGQLPAAWGQGFTALEHLQIADLTCSVLPPEWGVNQAFPRLRNLTIGANNNAGSNCDLQTNFSQPTLPDAWGSEGGMPALQAITISILAGTLPDAWGTQLTNLSYINFASGGLSGTLPASWGSLPLSHVELQKSHLAGPLPKSWYRAQSITLFPGNAGLCGSLPANVTIREQVLGSGSQFSHNTDGIGVGASNALNAYKEWPAAQLHLPQCGSLQAALVQLDAFVTFTPQLPPGLSSFLAPQLVGWGHVRINQSSPPGCSWTGVTCDRDGLIRGLNLSRASTNMSFTATAGYGDSLWPFSISKLDTLQFLDLSSNQISASLSGQWSFPELLYLNLSNTSVRGFIPSEWAKGESLPKLQSFLINGPLITQGSRGPSFILGPLETFAKAFPSLLYLDVSGNSNLSLPTGADGGVFSKLQWLIAKSEQPTQGLTIPGILPLPESTSAFPALTHLILDGNELNQTLPAWRDSFPSLQAISCVKCTLVGSIGLRGQPLLQTVRLSNNSLTGLLPSQWAQTSPQLAYVDLSLNRLGGSLPSSWSTLPFSFLSLTDNRISGTLPDSWGCGGQGWGQLVDNLTVAWLDLSSNRISGPIPESFGCPGSLRGLVDLYETPGYDVTTNASGGFAMSNNNLQGTLSATFIQAVPVAALLPGNLGLYNDSSAAADLYASASFHLINTLQDQFMLSDNVSLPGDVIQLNGTRVSSAFVDVTEPELPFQEEGLGPLLFKIKASFPDFDQVLDFLGGHGWDDDGTPACSPWSGLQCDATSGHLTAINFSGWNLQGTLAPEWSQLKNLQSMDLSGNPHLSGSLPPEWGLPGAFPALQHLFLGNNLNIGQPGGGLPPHWGSSWPQLRTLDLTRTGIQGSLPPDWGSRGAFPQLEVLSFDSNQLHGTLPAFGAPTGAASNLKQLQLGSCYFSGPLPEGYSSLQQLQFLDLSTNRLTHTLPASWGSDGNLRSLRSADLSANSLQGSLPSNWFSGGALQSLDSLNISNNAFEGRIAWQSTALSRLTVKPLNEGLCGTLPAGITAYSADGTATPSGASLGPCPSHLSGEAIAGIALGGVAALAVLGLLAALWRHQLIKAKERHRALYDPLAEFLAASRRSQSGSAYSSDQSAEDLHIQTSGLLSADESGERWVSRRNVDPERLTLCEKDGQYHKLGQGGFGTVYKALLDHEEAVAVKFLNPSDFASTASNREKFEQEIQLMRLCMHDNVVACIGACVRPTLIYCVMEYMDEGDLFSALAGDVSEPRQYGWYDRGQSVALDIAMGLRYLHDHDIVHLDLKSPNVLLNSSGQAKISDVGLARTLLTRTHISTLPGGTFDWQAPETLTGSGTSFPADIWSMGVVLLEIITGERQRRGFYVAPRMPEDCPQSIAGLVSSCMELDPKQRPTAAEVVKRIRLAGRKPFLKTFSSRMPDNPVSESF
ncbi:hypothetical protein WJX73_004931 [Symbiochloris irregularis]|uniref:Protein kinase domain-containing protein n=1 Tax=Symbiochloris irregularis TaxID=706552 RepID=A0AAW1NQB3_9CHLO